MEEIKVRLSVFDFFLTGDGDALYKPTMIETVCLQLRKILELVAMASLVANKDAYSEAHKSFAKHWNAKRLLQDIEKLNPDFYPRPVVLAPPKSSEAKLHFIDRDGDYLTKDEFVEIYLRCSKMLHADNPFAKKVDYKEYEKELPKWREKIVNLLDLHWISLLDKKELYLIQMSGEADGKVNLYSTVPGPA
jgi:hypothetical protein